MVYEEKATDVLYLENILKPLLQHPMNLEITRSVDEMGVYLVVRTHAEDMGRVIGRQGNSAKAIRILMRQFGAINQRMISLKIEEPVGGKRFYSNDGVTDSDARYDATARL